MILGNYRVLREIGRGGMGTVYRAVREPCGREFAIKMLHASRAWEAAAAQRFLAEARALAQFNDPHIVTVYDFNHTDDGHIYLVMELLDGEMLSDLIMREDALPLPRTLTILRQVAQALEVVHAHSIVHRDLKPDNVHIQPRGDFDFVKLLDFGIAKFPDLPDDPDEALGTPLYMSPEQIRAEDMDARTDIYGLGLLMYEMLTGKPPFSAFTAEDITEMHLEVLPSRPQLVRSDLHIPDAVEHMVLKALSKDPAQRQRSAREFLDELTAI